MSRRENVTYRCILVCTVERYATTINIGEAIDISSLLISIEAVPFFKNGRTARCALARGDLFDWRSVTQIYALLMQLPADQDILNAWRVA